MSARSGASRIMAEAEERQEKGLLLPLQASEPQSPPPAVIRPGKRPLSQKLAELEDLLIV